MHTGALKKHLNKIRQHIDNINNITSHSDNQKATFDQFLPWPSEMLDRLVRVIYNSSIPNNEPDNGNVMATNSQEQHQDRLKTISTRLKLRVSKRARRMTLRLDPETRAMHLIVPPRMNIDYAFDFAATHRKWIREKIAGLPDAAPFVDGAIIPFFGRDHYIEIINDDTRRGTAIDIKNRIMSVETNLDDASARIERYLREWVRDEIETIAKTKAAMIRRRIGDVRVRDTKSRWGSCAEDGNLSFCWRLVFAPREVIDYVVAHEVAHLVHFDHSPAFWRLCDRLSADMTYGRDWLKENGQTLMSYGSRN